MSQSSRRPWSILTRIDPYVWLVIAFSLFALLPLAGPDYFFGAHDAYNTIFFLTEFDAALRDGVWYPGWATDQALGYGYPTFVLIPPLAYYVAEIFHLLGATAVAAVKWTWALATIGASLAMYAYGRHVMGRQRGLLAAVVYVYVPYHLADIYVRAALAEYAAFVWMPLALLAFHRLTEKVTARRVGLAALAYGALLLTHNLTGMVFTVLLAVYVLFRLFAEQATWRERLGRAAAALSGALLGLGTASALILPNLFERTFINQQQWVRDGYDYVLHFVYPGHFLSPAWGFAPGPPGTEGGMSFQLGAVPLILAIVATVAAFRRPARERAVALFFAGATILIIFLMLPVSAPLWEALPLAALIQFPWRLLALTAVTLAILSGFAITGRQSAVPSSSTTHAATHNGMTPALSLRRSVATEAISTLDSGDRFAHARGDNISVIATSAARSDTASAQSQPTQAGTGSKESTSHINAQVLILALVAVLGSFPYTLPQYTPVPESAGSPLLSIEFELKFTDMRGMTAWTQEMPETSPLVDQYLARVDPEKMVTAEALAPGASLEMIEARGASDEMWVRSPDGTPLRFYTYYFPGWRVYVDGQRLPDSALRPETVYGLLTVDIPPGEHHVLLRWGDTPLRLTGKILTLLSLATALALVFLPSFLPRRRSK